MLACMLSICSIYSAETKLTVLYNNDYASTSKARKRLQRVSIII